MNIVIRKLKARYGEKYSDAAAQERDLSKERYVLEKSLEAKRLEDDEKFR
jgi:hypothetical protein